MLLKLDELEIRTLVHSLKDFEKLLNNSNPDVNEFFERVYCTEGTIESIEWDNSEKLRTIRKYNTFFGENEIQE